MATRLRAVSPRRSREASRTLPSRSRIPIDKQFDEDDLAVVVPVLADPLEPLSGGAFDDVGYEVVCEK